MTATEVFEMITESYDGDKQEIIEFVNEVLHNIRNNTKKFANELESALEDFASENDCCSICGLPLESKTDLEGTEYLGNPCYEETYSNYCKEHGSMD